ncbi:hypothetical protein ACFV2N_39115 [Streptomyces sp. NPDC059680]
MRESVDSGVVFCARAHAVRAVPLGAVVPVLLAAVSCSSLVRR